jgi:universal stress protein E
VRRFTNILFSPLGDRNNVAAARRVAGLASRNKATLCLFGVSPEPSRLQRALHGDKHIDAIREAEDRALAKKLTRWAPTEAGLDIETRMASGDPALSIIEQVLLHGHDLVVVTTDEDSEDGATIKRLLRKCPCPVWVIRNTRAKTQRVLAAINPVPEEAALNQTILELAVSLTHLYGGELHVVHAWELYGEATLQSSAFIRTTVSEIEALRDSERATHAEALAKVLTDSGFKDEPWQIHLSKGPAAKIIREVVTSRKINLLVMGTVARTGVAGLIVGNTAEAVLDDVRCSVVAVKPPGFVSPVELVVR